MVSAVSLAFLFTSFSSNAQVLDPTQTYTTGNIVLPTNNSSSWVNGVYQPTLTCWSWGDPGYCGPNPIVRPGNNINFSYGLTDLHQVQAISNVLPNSGTGLVVKGYNFGFMAKNGNGWDNGGLDTLNAYVTLYDTSNSVAFNKNYNLNYQFNWTNFNFSETFTTPFATNNLSNVQYGFIGRDNNGWAGPYGPEIYNISFSLKYSVDPCSVNVLSSPSCPGYLEAINSYSTATPITLGSVTVSTTPVISTTSDVQPTAVSVDAGGVQVSTTGTISAPDNIPQSVKESQKQESDERNKSSPNMSLIMSVVRQIQANDRAVENAAVSNALQEVSAAIANAQEQTNMAISNIQRNNDVQQQQSISSSSTSVVNSSTPMGRVDYSLMNNETIVTASMTFRNEFRDIQIEQIQQSNLNASDNPVNMAMQQRITPENSQTEQRTETVKSNVQPNELAGNVDISSMAVNPPGFNAYLSLALKDGQLYKPDEIYKNQVTVDNVRALRQLSSDRLHQQMVDQQYRK